MQAITLAITGASGAIYGVRLLEQLLKTGCQVHLLMSSAAKVVLATELDLHWPAEPAECQQYLIAHYGCTENQLRLYAKEDWFSPVASGSAAPKKMVICPCSMGTLAAIAHGMSDNLLERAADVVLKERGQLLLVARETPYSAIHLENMLKLTQLGATIIPASPVFIISRKVLMIWLISWLAEFWITCKSGKPLRLGGQNKLVSLMVSA